MTENQEVTQEATTPAEPVKVIVSFPAVMQIVTMYTPGSDTGKLVGDATTKLHELLRQHDIYMQQLPVSIDRYPEITEEMKDAAKAQEEPVQDAQ